jgi:hypothetical protein
MTAVGDPVCYTGYVMDSYCINRGELLDMPGKATLLYPHLHSLHCLLDPPQCTPRSGATYELLALRARDQGAGAAADGTNGPHGRAYGLDDKGSRAMLDFARAAGQKGGCTSCTNSSAAAPSAGFSATVTGTIADAAAAPMVLTNVKVHHGSTSCLALTGKPANITALDFASGARLPFIRAHGTCMLLSWGLLLPAGALTARYLRHRQPGGVWFKVHRAVQMSGLLLALVGWAIALAHFDVFTGPATKSTIHGGLGMTVMTLGLLQPLNAFFRPHPPERKTAARLAWERLHKGSGWAAVGLGLITVFIGTTLAAAHAKAFLGGFGACVCVLAAFALWARADGRRAAAAGGGGSGDLEMTEKEGKE